MFKLFLVFVLFSFVWSESVRETETWMPMQPAQTADVTHDGISASGDAPIPTSDFGFDDEDDDDDDDDYNSYGDEEEEDDEEMSGSGDGVPTVTIKTDNTQTSAKPNINENKIPEMEGTIRPRPTVNEIELVQNENEIPVRAELPQDHLSNVLMSHASDNQSFINKTEVLAGVIVGGAVTLLFAVLLILLLIYRMKKKDEGSYDLGRKPIYKKAPTTEIYA